MDIDGAPHIAFEAGIEKVRGILQCSTFGEGQLHHGLVGLAGADDAVMLPHRNAAPLPGLDHIGIGLLDEMADPAERIAPPITQFPDPRIDQVRGGGTCIVVFLRALALYHGVVAFLSVPGLDFELSITL